MVYGEKNEEKFEKIKLNIQKITPEMYVVQIVMLVLAFALGIYFPKFLDLTIRSAMAG